MKTSIDETDAEILRLLVGNARKPYTEIADEVGMSPPSVIDRIDRLRETGVIQGFEARLDTSVLDTTRLIVRFGVEPSEAAAATEALAEDEAVETAYASADATVTAVADAEPEEAARLTEALGTEVRDLTVEAVVEEKHAPTVLSPSFAPDCVECGNTVDEEGVTARFAGDVYHFCCTSCESAFKGRYEGMG